MDLNERVSLLLGQKDLNILALQQQVAALQSELDSLKSEKKAE